MSHEAAAEMERLNIRRQPSGTTRGGAQGQHTTTGVVEKHTDLAKLCMMKLRAEAERQGLEVNLADLAAEASFAQNATLNVGGYSPHMMVIGTLPMPYYDFDSPGILARGLETLLFSNERCDCAKWPSRQPRKPSWRTA